MSIHYANSYKIIIKKRCVKHIFQIVLPFILVKGHLNYAQKLCNIPQNELNEFFKKKYSFFSTRLSTEMVKKIAGYGKNC